MRKIKCVKCDEIMNHSGKKYIYSCPKCNQEHKFQERKVTVRMPVSLHAETWQHCIDNDIYFKDAVISGLKLYLDLNGKGEYIKKAVQAQSLGQIDPNLTTQVIKYCERNNLNTSDFLEGVIQMYFDSVRSEELIKKQAAEEVRLKREAREKRESMSLWNKLLSFFRRE